MVIQALDRGLRHGFDIADATGLRGGTVYPILRRLEGHGLIAGEWEEASVGHDEGRPARRYYRLLPGAGRTLAEARDRYPLHLDVRGETEAVR
jgi:DNA-binding PadR family transcriptional regulator